MICTSCNQDLPEENFHKDRSSPTGRKCHCAQCRKKRQKEWYSTNRGHILDDKARKYAEARPKKRELIRIPNLTEM